MINNHLKKDKEFLWMVRELKIKGYLNEMKIKSKNSHYNNIFTTKKNQIHKEEEQDVFKLLTDQFKKDSMDQSERERFMNGFSKLFNYKEDIKQQWFAHLQNFLISNSPFRILTFCSDLLNLRGSLSKRLFKPAFSIAWKIIDKTHQSEILNRLHWVIEKLKKNCKRTLKEILELIGISSNYKNL